MQDVFQWMQEHWAFCLFCLTCIIQITPAIKWNPITAFVKWLGKVIIQPAMDKLGKVENEIEQIKTEQRLLLHFGSVARIATASVEELSALTGKNLAERILKELNNEQ